jgi:TPR repeat protein
MAAEQGDVRAQYMLGTMYEEGQGVPQDYAEALRWYRLVAEQDDAWAQSDLGALYANGRGVPQDYVSAHMWFNLAVANGNLAAELLRDRVESLMTPADISEAQRRARVCFNSKYRDCD